MSYDRSTWFPNGLDWIELAEEIYTATGYFATITNTDPVIITTAADAAEVENIINNHNPQPITIDVEFTELDEAAFIANTNNLGIIFAEVTAATLTSVTTSYRADTAALMRAVSRHVAPYYYLRYPLSTFSDPVDLQLLESQLNDNAAFVRVEFNAGEVVVYTNSLIQDNSIDTIINNYSNPSTGSAPQPFIYKYTETELGYDPATINFAQLTNEIEAVLPAPINILVSSNPEDTCAEIYFDQEITKTTLDPVILNHVPDPQPTFVEIIKEPGTNVVKIAEIDKKIYGSQDNEIIIDKFGQGDFTTIKAAIEYYNNTSSTDGAVLIVRPGTYIEDNPLILPDRCNIKSRGTPGNTKIIAANNSAPLIILGKWCEVCGINTIGPANNIAFQFNCSPAAGSFSKIEDCIIYNCDIGIDCYGDTSSVRDTLLITCVLIHAASQNGTAAINIYDGGFLIANKLIITGTPPSYSWATGLSCVGSINSSATIMTMTCQYCDKGVVINGGFYQNVTSAIQFNNIGLEIGPNADGKLIIANSRLENNINLDLNILTNIVDLQIVSIFLSQDKINTPTDYVINMDQYTYRKGMTYEYMTGNISLGSHVVPTTTYFGSGDNNILGGTFLLDNTAEIIAVQPDADTAVETGWILYIGRADPISGIYLESDNSYNIEVWNSAAWETIKYSVVDEFILIKKTAHTTTVDGNNLYWVRVIFTAATTVNSIRFSENSSRISNNGVFHMLGAARVKRHISRTIKDWILGGAAAFTSIGFCMGINISTGFIVWNGSIPHDRDVSYPITINIAHAAAATFDISWGYLSDTATKIADNNYNSSGSLSAEIMPDNNDIWIRIEGAATISGINIDYISYKLGAELE